MKIKMFSTFVILAILMSVVGAGTAQAGAYEGSFITAITYQNVGTAPTQTLSVYFYESPSDTVPQIVPLTNLNPDASASLYVGSIIAGSFQGTAVMSADQPLAATLVQISSLSTVKVRPLSIGFSSGTPRTLLPTVLKNIYGVHTVFVVQNAGGTSTTATIKFNNQSAATVHSFNQVLEPGAGVHVDSQTIAQLGTSFDGSVVVESTGGTGSLVSSAMELGFGSNNTAKAFEGAGEGATKFYMPSALCKYSSPAQTSYYAIQNTDATNPTDVTVTYSNGKTQTKTVQPGAKQAFGGCEPVNMPSNFLGSATVESTGGIKVLAIGKVSNTPAGQMQTAFSGFSAGAQKIALPYVRWGNNTHYFASTTSRTYIAIQNVGPALAAGSTITVKYVKYDGAVESTHTLTVPAGGMATGAKVNSWPTLGTPALTEFGCYNNCTTFGGGAVIEGPAGSQLVAIARLTTWNGTADVAEDFNGIPYP